MAYDPLASPVVVDGVVSDEKLSELLAMQAEYPELDYKQKIDLSVKADEVKLAKDVGAKRVRGGYIVVGVDGDGKATGMQDDIDTRAFDEANLVPKLHRYLEKPLELRTNVLERDGHTEAVVR
jgi:hypothetical protein